MTPDEFAAAVNRLVATFDTEFPVPAWDDMPAIAAREQAVGMLDSALAELAIAFAATLTTGAGAR